MSIEKLVKMNLLLLDNEKTLIPALPFIEATIGNL
jgi:hypothetical protein